MSGLSAWTSRDEIFHAHFHCFSEVDFINHHYLRSQKHVQMFFYHPWSFGHTDDNDARFRTKRKFGRANQVPDVLDENQFQLREIDLAQTFADEVGVEMTTVDRRDLHDRNILLCDRIGVVARRGIAVENRDAQFCLLIFRPTW